MIPYHAGLLILILGLACGFAMGAYIIWEVMSDDDDCQS
jgi:hypothetical protein